MIRTTAGVWLAIAALGLGGCGLGQRDPDEMDVPRELSNLERGIRHFGLRDYEQAVEALNDAILSDSPGPDAYHFRGLAHYQLKNYEQSASDLTEAIRQSTHGRLNQYYVARAQAHWKLKRYPDALADIETLWERQPKDAELLNYLAWYLVICPDDECRDGKRALELAKQACELFPTAAYWDTLAAVYAELGQFDEAVQWQEKALANPDGGILQDLEGAERRLQLFKEKKPYREE